MKNKAVIAMAIALLLITVYQQGQLKQLRGDYKALYSQNLDLVNRLHDLEAQNEQTQAMLTQINARVGYMDSKVTTVIEKRTVNEQSERAGAESDERPETIETSPEKQEKGILDTLQELFH